MSQVAVKWTGDDSHMFVGRTAGGHPDHGGLVPEG